MLDVVRDPVKNDQFTIPFTTKQAVIAFNNQLNSLEVIGDWHDKTNQNHMIMTTTGSFSDASDSLFEGEMQFEVVHCSVR